MENVQSEKISLAFAQVYTYLISLPIEEIKKIPNKFWNLLNQTIRENTFVDPTSLYEDNLTEEAKSMLAAIYIDFLSVGEEQEKLKKIEVRRLQEIEQEKHDRYNPDNIFKTKSSITEEVIAENLPVLVKEKFLTRIINKIKNFFIGKR